jgi:hypothetical protein
MIDSTVGTRELIYAIISLPKQAKKLLGENKDYEKTLMELLKYNYYGDNIGLPAIKELCEEIGITRDKLKWQLNKIWEDLNTLFYNESDIALNIKEPIYSIYIKGWDKSLLFKCKLPICPKEGEYIQIPFIKYYFGYDFFYVDRVIHEIAEDKQIINLRVHQGTYNRYYKGLLDKKDYENYSTLYEDMYSIFPRRKKNK